MPSDRVSSAAERQRTEMAATVRASTAWADLSFGGPVEEARALKAPRHKGKSVVLSLGHVGPQGQGVVAKELWSDAASVELTVYRDILPKLTVRGPDLIGWIDSIDPERVWLFLEEIEGPVYDKTNPDHVAIGSRWLAALHAGTSSGEFDDLLAERGPEYHTSLAERTLVDLEDVATNPVLDAGHEEVLRRLAKHLSRLLMSRDSLEEVYRSLPTSLVHGDFKGNNMAFSSSIDTYDLRVFDWSEAHVGPLAIDTWWVDPLAYRTALEEAGFVFGPEAVDQWRRFGAMIRWVSATSWELPRLRYEWVDRPMRRMSLYESRLGFALDALPWVS